jgi:hypothetical protein
MKVYRGHRIAQLLKDIEELENRLKKLSHDANPFSKDSYDEVAQGYMYLAISKAKLKALQGSPA